MVYLANDSNSTHINSLLPPCLKDSKARFPQLNCVINHFIMFPLDRSCYVGVVNALFKVFSLSTNSDALEVRTFTCGMVSSVA